MRSEKSFFTLVVFGLLCMLLSNCAFHNPWGRYDTTTTTIPQTYSISYHLYDGTNDITNPSSYTVKTPTITLQVPTKDGYTFGGWYDNGDLSGDVVTVIPKGTTGDKALYAKWATDNYTITYTLYDGTNDIANPQVIQS